MDDWGLIRPKHVEQMFEDPDNGEGGWIWERAGAPHPSSAASSPALLCEPHRGNGSPHPGLVTA